jgi:DNA-binding CsgD family transcriptional regulator
VSIKKTVPNFEYNNEGKMSKPEQPGPGNKENVYFTKRQLAILRSWADSPTIASAAERLHISEHTVQTILKRMRKKLDVSRTFDVYKYAVEEELL